MNLRINLRAFMLGSNPVTKAIGKILWLFDFEITEDIDCDILVMVDGDKYDFEEFKEKNFNNNKKIIYLKSDRQTIDYIHPLCFLVEFYDTYHINLDTFNILDLIQTIGHIHGWEGISYKLDKRKEQNFKDINKSLSSEKIKSLYDNYPCLEGYADSLIDGFVHDARHWIGDICISSRIFIEDSSKTNYNNILKAFNNKENWNKIRPVLNEVLEELSKRGISRSRYPAVEQILSGLAEIETVGFDKWKNEQRNIQYLFDKVKTLNRLSNEIRTRMVNEHKRLLNKINVLAQRDSKQKALTTS